MTPLWGQIIPREAAILGSSERCLEIPFALEAAQLDEPGWVLDAGCALNGRLRDVQPFTAQVVHLTQALCAEGEVNFYGSHVSYVLGDLRNMSLFATGGFDRVVCVSTLEHIGMDNTLYGGPNEQNPASVAFALRELWRVTKTRLFITVPFHLSEESGCEKRWRFFTPATLPRLKGEEWHYYGRTDEGGWYGGGTEPMTEISTAGKVNQIACLWVEKA